VHSSDFVTQLEGIFRFFDFISGTYKSVFPLDKSISEYNSSSDF